MTGGWRYILFGLFRLLFEAKAFDNDNLFWCSANSFVYINTTKQWLSGSTNISPRQVNFRHPDARPSAASYLHRLDYLIFSDKGTKTIFLYRDQPTAHGVYAHVGVSEGIGELAVDWVNFNVYWCDGIYSWIGLQALPRDLTGITNNDKQMIVIEKALQKPYGIAVSPQQRFIFWTDYGETPRIERSSLAGFNRRTLIWMRLKKPMSITADPSTSKLFWIDNARATLETCDFEGLSRQVLLQRLGYSLTSVTVFEEHLLYTEKKGKSIHAVSKVTGLQSARDLAINTEPVGVSVFSESLQPFTQSVCDNHGCSHICVQEASGPTCVCDGGFTLSVDSKTCRASSTNKLWKSLLYSNGVSICAFPVTTFNSHEYVPIEITCLTSGVSINFLAPDVQSSSVFYTSLKSIKRKVIGGDEYTVATSSSEITGLVLDPVERHVFWSEKDAGVIMMAGLSRNSQPNQVYTGLRSPAALAIDPKNRKLFWISAIPPGRIETGDITGGTVTVLVGTDLKQPVRLAFHPRRNRLYWTEDGRIGSILADGRKRAVYSFSPLPTYTGISIFKDYLVWMMTEQSVNMSVSVISDSDGNIIRRTTFFIPNITVGTDIAIYDTDNNPTEIHGCESDNGGCQQICLPLSNSHQCACNFGFTLESDSKTCRSDVVDSDFFLVLDDTKLYQVVNGDTIHGIGILSANTPTIVTYDTRGRHVVWYDGVRRLINKANMDGSGESVIIGTEDTIVRDLAVDMSTSNIYYTVTSLGGGSVRVVTNDGGARRTLVQTTRTPGPLAIYPKSGVMVWGEGSVIKMSDMSGRDVSTLMSSGLNSVSDIDIDNDGNTLYIADSEGDKLESFVLQTRSRKILRQNTQEFPTAISVKGDNLYYLTKSGRSVKTIHKSSGGELPAISDVAEFGHLTALYVYVEGQTRANTVCSTSNGGCSTLCLPTSSGGVCACADGVSLQADEKICERAVKCPETLLHGKLLTGCSPYTNSICSYSCDIGYEAKSPDPISCTTLGVWNASLDTLCVVEPSPTPSPKEDPPVAIIVGACAAAIIVVAVVVLAVICYKRRKAFKSRPKHLAPTRSQQPIITVTKDEIYDEIRETNANDTNRYSSFSRISPNFHRRDFRELSEIQNPAYVTSNDYLTATTLLPVPAPRPLSTFTPNTRRKMFRSESPMPDYETPKSGSPSASYIDLTTDPRDVPLQSSRE